MQRSSLRAWKWALALTLALAGLGLTGCGDDTGPAPQGNDDTPSDAADHERADADAQPADGEGAGTSAQITSPPDPLAGWITYRHALGASLRHPGDWTTQQTQAGVLLLPPDAQQGSEMVVFIGGPAQPGQDPASDQTAAQLDQLIAQLMPVLRRSAAPSPATSAHGDAALYIYTGTAPDGQPATAQVYLTINDGTSLAIILLGHTSRVDARTPTVQTIFSTLSMNPQTAGGTADAGNPDTAGSADTDDPRLIGVFRGEALASSPGVYVNTQLVYVLNADGTFYSGAQSHFNQSQRDHNGRLKWAITDQTDNNVLQGTWSARGGVLTVAWSNGTRSVFAYNFEPDGNLVMRDPVSRELINFYVRVQ